MGDGVGVSLFVQSIIPVVSDLGLSRSDVIAWGAAVMAVLLVPYMVNRLLDLTDDWEDEDDDD